VLASASSSSLGDRVRLRAYLGRNPVRAWAGGRGTGGQPFFARDGDTFRSTFSVPAERRAEFQELVAELVEWRLAAYLRRAGRDNREPGRP
jgi:hypothetical protein